MQPDSRIEVSLQLRNARRFQRDAEGSARSVDRLGAAGTRAGRGGARGLAKFAQSGERLQRIGRGWSRNVTLPVLAVGAASVKAAVDWESAFAGVRKTVDATEGQYAQLASGLRDMSEQVGTSAIDLAGIAESAGQLGIKRNAILGFTRTIADLGVSTNLAGEEAASSLARFANITQMPQGQFDRLGSTIVALGNAGASTEKDIVSMGLRIAGAGSFVGMSEHQILGFANALSSVGIEAEAGGTAISTTFKKINTGVADGGAGLAGFAKVAGMSSGRFKAAWERDAAGATVTFIEGLGRLRKEGANVPAVLDDLGLSGIRVQDTLLRASGAGDQLRKSLGLGGKSWRDNTALSGEANKRYATSAERMKRLRNRVKNLGVSLGEGLLPPLLDVVGGLSKVVRVGSDAFDKLPKPVKSGAVAFAGLLAAVGPVTWALGGTLRGLGKVKRGLKGMKGIFARVFGRAGVAGGTAASTSTAATTAAQTPKKLARKRGVFMRAGATTGTAMGTATGTAASTATASTMVGSARSGRLRSAFTTAGRLLGPAMALSLALPLVSELDKKIQDWARRKGATELYQSNGPADNMGDLTPDDPLGLGKLLGLPGSAKGGLIGMARGGSVMQSLVPPGEDTVRGLQYGEFVMRRKAVETHGVDAMERINRGMAPAPAQVAVPVGAGGGRFMVDVPIRLDLDGKAVHSSVERREARAVARK